MPCHQFLNPHPRTAVHVHQRGRAADSPIYCPPWPPNKAHAQPLANSPALVKLQTQLLCAQRAHHALGIRTGPVPTRSTSPPSPRMTHAQVEELVQRTQRSVLELVHAPEPVFSAMPLSARLAAYGERLALERQLREGSGARRASEVCAGRGDAVCDEAAVDECQRAWEPRGSRGDERGAGREREGARKREARGRERWKGSGRRPRTAESAAGEGGFLTLPKHAVLTSPARNGHGHLHSRSSAPPGLEHDAGDHRLELDLGAVASLETEVPRTLSASASPSALLASRMPNASTLFAPRTPDTSTLFAPHPTPASTSDHDVSRSLDVSVPVVTLAHTGSGRAVEHGARGW
ncbi:hypothetical protein OF83DRAFT_1189470 [Amylostereum chailletii]|nr:hypothetical protein OF83DRAFT_1189470 [Amylostereum chailletii]